LLSAERLIDIQQLCGCVAFASLFTVVRYVVCLEVVEHAELWCSTSFVILVCFFTLEKENLTESNEHDQKATYNHSSVEKRGC